MEDGRSKSRDARYALVCNDGVRAASRWRCGAKKGTAGGKEPRPQQRWRSTASFGVGSD